MKTELLNLDFLLSRLAKEGGSDLHLKVGVPPIMRKNGKLFVLDPSFPILNRQLIDQHVTPLLTPNYYRRLTKNGSVDIGYGIKDVGRFRLNVFFQRGSIRIVARYIPNTILTIEELNLPKKYKEIVDSTERGLILLAGATGSGKSTSLAALIDYINKTRSKHILTIEDPIEFLIKDHRSLITQRELGVDCEDPVVALKSSLRQDPDVILFSELRSADSILTALIAAETGHLVFSTIHTQDAAETINRIIGVFDGEQQPGIRSLLAATLKAVFAQRLLVRKDNGGYIPATEIMINTGRIRKAIEMGTTTKKISSFIKEGQLNWGMITFNQSLLNLLKEGIISEEEAYLHASSVDELKIALSGVSVANQEEEEIPEKMKRQQPASTGEAQHDLQLQQQVHPEQQTSDSLQLQKATVTQDKKRKKTKRA